MSPDFGSATAKTHIKAAASGYPDDITQIRAEGDIAGFAHANLDVPPNTTTPKARASTSYDFQFQSSDGHTAFPYSLGVDFSGTNQDHDTCVVLQVEFQGQTGSGHSFDKIMTRNVGGGCANRGSGSLPTEGNLLAGATSFGVGGRVDAEKKGTVSFSGHVSVDVGVGAGAGCSAATALSGVIGAQQCTQTPIGQLVSQAGGPSDVFVMDPGGFDPAQPLNLSATPNKNERSPAWSPDGKHVAFEQGGQIFTMTAGGSDLKQLTTNGLNEEPAWSPDGSQIAFTSNRDGNFELYVMGKGGSSQTRLTHNQATDSEPDWSPDGNTIAFDSDRHGNPDIFSMAASPGAGAVRLTNDPADDLFPAFVPDGTLVFQTDRDGNEEIYSMQGDGENPKDLTNDPGQDGEPTVSPDGQFVAFSSSRHGSDDLWFVPIAGGDATQITHHADATFADWGISACTLYGTGGNDTITGDGHVCGGPGDDHLTGGGSNDTLDGGPGADTIKGGSGRDEIFGWDGKDNIQGGEGVDDIQGGPGDDDISGGVAWTSSSGRPAATPSRATGSPPTPPETSSPGVRMETPSTGVPATTSWTAMGGTTPSRTVPAATIRSGFFGGCPEVLATTRSTPATG